MLRPPGSLCSALTHYSRAAQRSIKVLKDDNVNRDIKLLPFIIKCTHPAPAGELLQPIAIQRMTKLLHFYDDPSKDREVARNIFIETCYNLSAGAHVPTFPEITVLHSQSRNEDLQPSRCGAHVDKILELISIVPLVSLASLPF